MVLVLILNQLSRAIVLPPVHLGCESYLSKLLKINKLRLFTMTNCCYLSRFRQELIRLLSLNLLSEGSAKWFNSFLFG